jgi:hypothetical protein
MRVISLEKATSPRYARTDIIIDNDGPFLSESAILYSDGEEIGFFYSDISEVSKKAKNLLDIANTELMSKRVPKSGRMGGGGKGGALDKGGTGIPFKVGTSAIIGATPPKPYLGRPYKSMSSLHLVGSAQTYIKAMVLLARETQEIIKNTSEYIFKKHFDSMKGVDKKWKISDFYTSSVSNVSCTVPVHSDKKNIVGTVNAIYCKRSSTTGGNLMLPDYGLTIDQKDYSLLVYPAWRDLHGVTPISKSSKKGYRNSLVFYSLKEFKEI